jgi:diguanylate cyclase
MGPNMDTSELPCGFLVLDQRNTVVEANAIFCRWFGYEKQEIINKPFSVFFIPASKMVYLGHILPELQTVGVVEEKYLMLKTASGIELPMLINANKIQREQSHFFAFSLMKMQRRHLIEEQLIYQRRQAEQATAEKDLLNEKLQRTQAELILKQQELLQLNVELEALSVTDALTGLFNRRFYDKELDSQVAQYQRTQQKFALILIDIDFFKSINDMHGHEMGDTVLQVVSKQLKSHLRKIDTLARIGGEEFAIILPNCNVEAAMTAAERQRKSLEEFDELPFKVTASFGVTSVLDDDSKTSIYNRADHALYLSKNNGRNCVTLRYS